MERTYYTLDDIRIAVGISPNLKGPYAMKNSAFSTFLNSCLSEAGFDDAPYFSDTAESVNCFQEYIWPRFYQEAIIYGLDFIKKLLYM